MMYNLHFYEKLFKITCHFNHVFKFYYLQKMSCQKLKMIFYDRLFKQTNSHLNLSLK